MSRYEVAVVTGGGSGIGEALSRRLAKHGTKVAVVDLHGSKAKAVAGSLPGAIAIGADVGVEDEVQAMAKEVTAELGPIDLYCSNAGVATGGPLGTDAEWELGWKVHVAAHVYAARAVLPDMAERGGGAMVLTASAAGLLALTQSAPYTVTKHATVALAEWLAIQWGDRVQFACLCPQGVQTPILGDIGPGRDEVALAGAVLQPEQVADDVFRALDDKRFLVLPHPEVAKYEAGKVADRDRWLAVMRKLASHFKTGS